MHTQKIMTTSFLLWLFWIVRGCGINIKNFVTTKFTGQNFSSFLQIKRQSNVTEINQDDITNTHTQHNRFTALSGTTRVSRCQKRTSGLYGAR